MIINDRDDDAQAEKENPEVIDDWPLHPAADIKTTLSVGACWHGQHHHHHRTDHHHRTHHHQNHHHHHRTDHHQHHHHRNDHHHRTDRHHHYHHNHHHQHQHHHVIMFEGAEHGMRHQLHGYLAGLSVLPGFPIIVVLLNQIKSSLLFN